MSPLKLNSLLIGIFLAMFVAMGSSTMAQDGLRLWKPYSPESFGGGRRSNDGVYGTLSGILYSFSTPKGGYIGATSTKGNEETRWVYNGSKVYEQTNSVKINMMDPTTSLGTRFEVGNRRGHHGWLVGGYGLPGQGHSMSVQNISMAIRDEGNLTFQPFAFPHLDGSWGGMEMSRHIYLWDRNHNSMYDPTAPANSQHYPFADWQYVDGQAVTTISGIGYLWGVYRHMTDEGVVGSTAIFAPLPIWFKDVDINVSSSHYSAELMYTYRAHPFAWGTMELLAGARYWDFEDGFKFSARGPSDTSDTTTTDDNANATGSNVDPNFGPISVLANMSVDARANNRIFGPQVGMKLNRQNARWTFGLEGRLTAGINVQSVRTQGYIASNYDYATNYWAPWATEDHPTGSDGGITDRVVWVPIGLQYNNTNFGHRQNKSYFSPIGELRLSADWQWTNAVSFFGAVDGMFAGNIARGVRVTDYVVHSDGTIFGIRGSDRNTNVFVYGVEAGIKVSR